MARVDNGAVMVYSTNNEQGFAMKLHGTPKRTVVDFEGIQLLQISNSQERASIEME